MALRTTFDPAVFGSGQRPSTQDRLQSKAGRFQFCLSIDREPSSSSVSKTPNVLSTRWNVSKNTNMYPSAGGRGNDIYGSLVTTQAETGHGFACNNVNAFRSLLSMCRVVISLCTTASLTLILEYRYSRILIKPLT